MNNTTGADPTALSIALFVSVDRKDFCRTTNRGERRGLHRGRNAWPATLQVVSNEVALTGGGFGDSLPIALSVRTSLDVNFNNLENFDSACGYDGRGSLLIIIG